MLRRYCPHLEQRVRDLPERAAAHRLHQHLEHVAVRNHRVLQALQHGRRFARVQRLKFGQPLQLTLLLGVGGAAKDAQADLTAAQRKMLVQWVNELLDDE